ncbi:glycerophosphodiester phosphodiesterase [Flavobacterium plurextorum]|uniref:glycerophosphodiester phosphodiesterase family protein n=1 Tax=Flavobacterium TaxID=237 RepID=UPI00214DBCDA|nr:MULTISPECIES: glycerophosphodiester phosphodiesterase family protein [Flavobacterium]UUW07655.1 glycerophosphodiester phosphodiesterase [Flavobacterium plurextorum]
MIRTIKAICILAVFLVGYNCAGIKNNQQIQPIEVQGHRGDRGSFPENTIPAFLSAVKKGAAVIEMDVVISKDQKVVVSHETFMSAQYMNGLDGKPIKKDKEKSYNLFEMTYDSIKRFDSGSRGNAAFAGQQKMKTYKPLLSEVIDSVENYISKNKLKPVKYNIEIKSEKEDYNIRQPQPDLFSAMVIKIIKDKGIEQKINIQSFDPTVLNGIHKTYPKIQIAFLVGEDTFIKNLSMLDFVPQIYSPYHKLLNKEEVALIRSLKIRVIPWTVNEDKDIDFMLRLKVDGIITDYPEKVLGKL